MFLVYQQTLLLTSCPSLTKFSSQLVLRPPPILLLMILVSTWISSALKKDSVRFLSDRLNQHHDIFVDPTAPVDVLSVFEVEMLLPFEVSFASVAGSSCSSTVTIPPSGLKMMLVEKHSWVLFSKTKKQKKLKSLYGTLIVMIIQWGRFF
ncbi:unnamed protein product [Ambrosiozyma monospora]|uniref:Unnamed protein product n=1 Tax=Ambrosiozyma monospora TaxID=43982 RepID=A0A9W6YZR5_AMBMO|nr:unnamed protein product [Ambrosiozyma monospora]